MGLSGLGGIDLTRVDDVPGQQFLDAVDGMFWKRREDGPQVEGWIEPAELGCTDEAVERCGALAT